jgi:16S rRNA (guanine966-N2)-methyltransferase
LRVTGGQYRGRQILFPPGMVRPSMDRMRISVFSVLGDLSGLSFLDLFSGSGAIGIEAASRGAEPVVLVEKDPRKKETIGKNISFVESRIELVLMPVERFLHSDSRNFDIIFLDPPFDFPAKESILDDAAKDPHLAVGGLAMIHLHRAENLSMDRHDLVLEDRREYGQSLVLFFRRA